MEDGPSKPKDGEDAFGKKFYNLNPDASAFMKNAPSGSVQSAAPAGGINLFFSDEESSTAEGDSG